MNRMSEAESDGPCRTHELALEAESKAALPNLLLTSPQAMGGTKSKAQGKDGRGPFFGLRQSSEICVKSREEGMEPWRLREKFHRVETA